MGEKTELNDEELDKINGGVDTGSKNSDGDSCYCQYCPKSFPTLKALKKHIKSAHPGEPIVY